MATAKLPAEHSSKAAGPLSPMSIRVDSVARMLNVELADDPVYDGLELQWFDDDAHGTGLLAFLCRRADRRVDYYLQRGLQLDPSGYEIAGGLGHWRPETDFEVARLEVAVDGVDAEVRFIDVDGRLVEVRVDDRDGRPRRRAPMLAPVSAGIERPGSLLLVWMPDFDLVRTTGPAPLIRIGGRDVAFGRLPGARLHRRHLVKYAASLCAAELNRNHDGPLPTAGPGQRLEFSGDDTAIAAIVTEHGGHHARVTLDPALPDVSTLLDGSAVRGNWHVSVDGVRLTGGRWCATRDGDRVQLGLDVVERWRPGRLPWLMRVVTTVVPVFRRWPTTYRWRADVTLGACPSMVSRWERIDADRGEGYRRATGSRSHAGTDR